MRPPSSSKPRSPTTDAIQSAGPAHAAQALLPRTTPSPRLASPGRGLLRRPGADGASAPFGQQRSRPRAPGRSPSGERRGRATTPRALAPAIGRAGPSVRSAMIENRTAAEVRLPAPSLRRRGRDVHRHDSRGRGRDPSPCSSGCSPAAPTRCRSRRPRFSSSRPPSTTWCPRPRSSTAPHRRRATSLVVCPRNDLAVARTWPNGSSNGDSGPNRRNASQIKRQLVQGTHH